ncbi:GNAT family N-acetyltransferase [Amycolatopsis sp. K13G38]|uniref:GNAT family N-acetyltransferase n=1 Tax=Amycolatopsis acididurans TaxID=2724524 RepID=A0ABX1J5L4_9PSEU|nr:GNAT family N-acetyltransferase [Amycolatopsis acididurans]NKQ55043.1 GNAT family N-acetyltransferase [Amycolatopsis acididurans]
MALSWTKEETPRWDAAKRAVFGEHPPDVFGLKATDDQVLADEWWKATDGDEVVGYGRLDSVWGDAEILVAVAPSYRGRGIGEFVLDRLEREAAREGLNYIYNTVRDAHPDRAHVTSWLCGHGFAEHPDGQLRKRVSRT